MWTRIKGAGGLVVGFLIIGLILFGMVALVGEWFGPTVEKLAGIVVVVVVLLALAAHRETQGPLRRFADIGLAALGGFVLAVGVGIWAQNIWAWWKTGIWLGPSAGVIGYLVWRTWRGWK